MEGPLTAATVPALWERRQELFAHKSLDLAQVTQIDSAGVAFLAQWAIAQRPQPLTLLHAPENALRLIKTFKLDPLFVLS